MAEIFDTISSQIIKNNPYWSYQMDTYIMPNGQPGDYHFVKSHGSVFIIPIADNGAFYLTAQYRYLNKKQSIEFPGGGVNPDYSIRDNAVKELAEELGLKAEQLTEIGNFNPCNGMTDEICTVFVAYGLENIEAVPDDSEQIETITMTKTEINNAIKKKEIWDGMTLAAWSLYNIIME